MAIPRNYRRSINTREWVERDSGTNAAATATHAAVAGKRHYLSGFMVSASAAPSAPVTAQLRENSGGTLLDEFLIPANAFLPLIVEYRYPIAASSLNMDIDITLPALGAGITGKVSLYGFSLEV